MQSQPILSTSILPLNSTSIQNSYLANHIGQYYMYSLFLYCVLLLLCVLALGLAISRKLKQLHVEKQIIESSEELQNIQLREVQGKQQMIDGLVEYFDKKQNNQEVRQSAQDQNKGKGQNKEQEKNKQHQQQEENKGTQDIKKYQNLFSIQLELSLLQPFLLGSIFCHCIMSTNLTSTILICSQLILFIVFNLFRICPNIPILSILFTLPAIGSYLPALLHLIS